MSCSSENNKFNNEYFLVLKGEGERLPLLKADEKAIERNYTFEPQPVRSPPLFFMNGSKDYDKRMGIAAIKELPDVLFNGTNLVVCNSIRKALLAYDIPHLHPHPAVYIHDDNNWHEDYWFLTFSERFDCWDRQHSDYEIDALEMGGMKLHSVYSYSLDKALMDRTPLENRLLFKMGGTQDAFIVCHQTLSHLFLGADRGTQLKTITEY